MLFVETRHAISPSEAKGMDTAGLRAACLGPDLFTPGQIRLIYTHYDRMIVGGVVPAGDRLTLAAVQETGTTLFMDRRELGVVNIGAELGTVSAQNDAYDLAKGDVLYLPMGSGEVVFSGHGRLALFSAPAHQRFAPRLIKIAEAKKLTLGAAETANHRTINQFIHPDVMPSCQLVLGYTQFHAGSVWNTMPAHLHDRRMEAYLYFDIPDGQRVFHLMGRPDETRHLVMKNEEAALSPPWSIHCGAGTAAYSFIWAMAGDNVDYRDADPVAMEDLR